jgi:high-affinity nickel-transport protein
MISAAAFAAFSLGLRHGADPDHLAAIDNLTRNAFTKQPKWSRFCGALFALGHSIMVLAIAALVGIFGAPFMHHGSMIETAGTIVSIAVLALMATLNLIQLFRGSDRLKSARTNMLPKILRDAKSPWVSIPVGLLFGLGFETSSQIATYTVAFGANRGLIGALTVGAVFCVGMICTDLLDSVLVHRLVSEKASLRPAMTRLWIGAITLIAVVVALYESAQLAGWSSPVPDIYVSGMIVTMLFAVFGCVFFFSRPQALLS